MTKKTRKTGWRSSWANSDMPLPAIPAIGFADATVRIVREPLRNGASFWPGPELVSGR